MIGKRKWGAWGWGHQRAQRESQQQVRRTSLLPLISLGLIIRFDAVDKTATLVSSANGRLRSPSRSEAQFKRRRERRLHLCRIIGDKLSSCQRKNEHQMLASGILRSFQALLQRRVSRQG